MPHPGVSLTDSPSRSTAGVAGVTGTNNAVSAKLSKGKPSPAAVNNGFFTLRDAPLMFALTFTPRA